MSLLADVAKSNLAGAAAVLVVLALRKPMRKALGPRAAYGLWTAVPLAALAVLLPHPAARAGLISAETVAAVEAFVPTPAATPRALEWSSLALWLWAAGALAMLAWLSLQQARFGIAERKGLAGPAVVGLFRPRIVTPADFEARFPADDRTLILEHERTHLRGGDAAANALVCGGLCLAWFNPLAHLAARLMRIDQELACDAAVVGRFPQARKRYAELLLKTQIANQALPLGCHWPPRAAHPLKERIAMLKSPLPRRAQRLTGALRAGAVAAGAGLTAWAAEPSVATPIAAVPSLAVSVPQSFEPATRAKAAKAAKPLKPLKLAAAATDPTTPGPDALLNVARQTAASVVDPIWIDKPTPAELARAAVRGSNSGAPTMRASLRCIVSDDGHLRDCGVARFAGADQPAAGETEFAQAALELSKLFRMRPTDDDGSPTAGKLVTIPIFWGRPDAGPPSVIVQPDWEQKPTGEDMALFYPPKAVAEHVEGMATIGCKVSAEGLLVECRVVQETPPDAGFGEAALRMSQRFKMKPMSRDGHPVSGGVVRIPIRFALPSTPAPTT